MLINAPLPWLVAPILTTPESQQVHFVGFISQQFRCSAVPLFLAIERSTPPQFVKDPARCVESRVALTGLFRTATQGLILFPELVAPSSTPDRVSLDYTQAILLLEAQQNDLPRIAVPLGAKGRERIRTVMALESEATAQGIMYYAQLLPAPVLGS